jgi:dTDP-4-amino-4,6-dideoxy-D-galactose acyltransferase
MQVVTPQTIDTACEILDWDSAFFGFPIARLNLERLTEANLKDAVAWCRTNDVRCLYLLVDSKQVAEMRLAEATNFLFVGTRLVYEKRLSQESRSIQESDISIRLAQPSDLPALRTIAGNSYRVSRFYTDPGFPRHLCDRLYETWIEKSCSGYADSVLVAHTHDLPVGYISCHLQDEYRGQIGLVGVSGNVRAKGVGTRLIKAATEWFAEKDTHAITVVTQGSNIAAQRLYQRSGFLICSTEIWYHLWLDEPNESNG